MVVPLIGATLILAAMKRVSAPASFSSFGYTAFDEASQNSIVEQIG